MTNVAEPQVLPPQAPQAPGSLINNPSRIGLNVGPGTLVYRTSYGYLIVNPGGESIALSPSLNVIRQQTQLSNIRTTAVSQVVGTGGAIGSEGKPSAPTTTTEIVQSGGRAYEVVKDVYGNVVRAGSVVTPEAPKVPSPLTGQILTPSQAVALQKLPVGAPVSTVLPKPLQPTQVSDISRLQNLGFSTKGLTASYDPETGRLTTVQYPERISPIPSGLGYQPITVGRTTYKPTPPTEAEKYALYPTLKSTQDFSKAISEGAEKYLIPLVPYTPVGAVRPTETKAMVRGIVGGAASIPEFFATGAIGAEYVGREIAAGRGKALPEALAIGTVEMGKGVITSFREKPIETTGQFIGQSLVFGGTEAGIREIKIPKMSVEGLRPIRVLPELKNLITTPLKPIRAEGYVIPGLPKEILTREEAIKAKEIKIPSLGTAYKPETPGAKGIQPLLTREEYIKTLTPTPKEAIYIREAPGFKGLQPLLTKEEAAKASKPLPIKPLPEFYLKEVPSYGFVPQELTQFRYMPRAKTGVSKLIAEERAVSYIPTFEREAKPYVRRQVLVAEREPITTKPLFTKTEVEKMTRTLTTTQVKTKVKPFIMVFPKVKTVAETKVATKAIPKTRVKTSVIAIPQTRVATMVEVSPMVSTSTLTKSAIKTASALKTSPIAATRQAQQIQQQIEQATRQAEKQLTKQATQFEMPTEQILKLKIPSDVTEQFFTRRKKKAKKKPKVQKVYAPVLNPLFDVVMQKATRTKPFKIIDITKKRKRR